MKVTYFLDVTSSWCHWAEPAWAELKKRYAGEVEFAWKIALMEVSAFPVSREQCEWFYRRSGTVTGSSYLLNAGWYEGPREYLAPNLTAEAARDFCSTPDDDQVRLAIAQAGVLHGQPIGQWEEAVRIAAQALGADANALRERAKSAEVEARARASTAEFFALAVNQRPAFLMENSAGDRAIFSGIATAAPLTAAIDALLADERAQISYKAHHGGPPAC